MQDHTKLEEAVSVVHANIGELGIWASAEEETKELPGYQGLCWTRDFAIGGLEALFQLEQNMVAEDHVIELTRILEEEGVVPVFFRDVGFSEFQQKLAILKKDPKRIFPYSAKFARRIIEKMFSKFGLPTQRYTPHTTDTELHYLSVMIDYSERSNKPDILSGLRKTLNRVVELIEGRMENGLYYGADWRDNVTELEKSALLSNNVLLYKIYKGLSYNERAANLKQRIRETFWNDDYYCDLPSGQNTKEGRDHFDAFGQALAVLYGVADSSQYERIIRKFTHLDSLSKSGFKSNDLELPPNPTKIQQRVNQYGTIWPMVTGHVILALSKMAKEGYQKADALALKLFSDWTEQEGFREWYNPETGDGMGAIDTMWSAALYLRSAKALDLIPT